MAELQFLGATGTVTGSKYLLEHEGFRMLVDCGLFQGLKELRERNWAPPPVEARSLDLIVLTHAHLDHSGYLPAMIKHGYRGTVLATAATVNLCGVLLPDSGHIQEEDARWANKRGYSKHRPALPLYTEAEARGCLDRFRPAAFDRWVQVHDKVRLRFAPAGHILGASFIEVRLTMAGGEEKTIVFGGDLGRIDWPIIPDPAALPECDHLLLESTYGNRDHADEDPKGRLAEIIADTVRRGGTLLVPAFAVGRTQSLLYMLRELQQENRLASDIPIYVDSPMAIRAISLYVQHDEAQDIEMRDSVSNGSDPLGLRHVVLTAKVEESKAINAVNYPAIIISASGMATGGRILHHMKYRIGDHRTTVLFAGHQAAGTRGRSLQDGAKTVRIHGESLPVRARIETLDGMSAHADRNGLIRWLGTAKTLPGRVHLVHGEPDASAALAERLRDEKGLDAHLPKYLEKVEL